MKRGQIFLGETFFVVVILIILIVIGIVIYAGAQERETTVQETFFRDLDAIAVSKYLTQLTELQCSTLQVQQANCIDIYKLEGLERYRQEYPDDYAQYYFTQLLNAKLSIIELYPPPPSGQENKTWVLYNNTLPEGATTLTRSSFIPVSLLNPITAKQTFGVLQLETYYR
jgi:hypothetical protein